MSRKPLTNNQKIINNDITRFKNNSLASNLVLLSLVFECLYFLAAYSHNGGTYRPPMTYYSGTRQDDYLYTIEIGVSVVLNLAILLSVFYASVKIKAYDKTFCYVVWVVAVIQIIRIFIYPVQAYGSFVGNAFSSSRYFSAGELIWLIFCLVASAACLIAAGAIGLTKALNREKFVKQLENNEIDLEAAYKEEDVVEEVVINA